MAINPRIEMYFQKTQTRYNNARYRKSNNPVLFPKGLPVKVIIFSRYSLKQLTLNQNVLN